MYCWKCGDHNPDDYRFCGACGQSRDSNDVQSVHVRDAAKLPGHLEDLLEDIRTSGVADKTVFSSSQISHQFTITNRDGSQTIVHTDTQGRRREFTSVDQMPSDVREAYEGLMARNPMRAHGSRRAPKPRAVYDEITRDPLRIRRRRGGVGIMKIIAGLFVLIFAWRMCR